MRRVDLLISAAHALTMDGPGVGYLADAALAVDRSRIVAVGPRDDIVAEYSAERTLHGSHHVMLPGFIDAHMHTAWCLLRGLAQDTRHWMMHGLGPFSVHTTQPAMDAGTRLAVLEAVKAGTTTFGDFGWSMDSVCEFFERVGVRGAVAVTIREAEPRTTFWTTLSGWSPTSTPPPSQTSGASTPPTPAPCARGTSSAVAPMP